MNFAEVREELGKYAEADFAAFSGKIICTQYPIMGVRTPKLREISKKTTREYLESEPKYYEEVVMHGLTLGAAALTAEELFGRVELFLSFTDNWGAVDICTSSMKAFKKDKENCFAKIREMLFDKREFHARFAAVAMLDFYIDEQHIDEVLELYSRVESGRYYVDMAVAWGLSVAAVKFYGKTTDMIEKGAYGDFVTKKALSKCMDSFRITPERKEHIRSLRKSLQSKNG